MDAFLTPNYLRNEERNATNIALGKHCEELIHDIKYIRKFFDCYTSMQNDVILPLVDVNPWLVKHGRRVILLSVEQTLGSLESVCALGNFSDAHILLRKCRDDLFFYLYSTTSYENEEAVKNIKTWMQNDLSNLHFSCVLKSIGSSSKLSEVVKKYNLQKSFNTIGKKLNDFTHGNGMSLYNKRYEHYREGELKEICDSLKDALNHIVVTFVFLEALCNPMSLMGNHYVDYLDCGLTPLDGSEYWVSAYVTDFFNDKKKFLDEDCAKYLQDNTGMQLLDN